MVIGGGIAGQETALNLADMGKKSVVGGKRSFHRRQDDSVEQGVSHARLRSLYHDTQDVGDCTSPEYNPDAQQRGE